MAVEAGVVVLLLALLLAFRLGRPAGGRNFGAPPCPAPQAEPLIHKDKVPAADEDDLDRALAALAADARDMEEGWLRTV